MRDTYFETDGKRNGEFIFCPVNAIGDCPYCDKKGHCRMKDPIADCDDFNAFWDSWESYDNADEVDPDAPTDFAKEEIEFARHMYGYEPIEDYEDDDA